MESVERHASSKCDQILARNKSGAVWSQLHYFELSSGWRHENRFSHKS